jgi:hypothetical protein
MGKATTQETKQQQLQPLASPWYVEQQLSAKITPRAVWKSFDMQRSGMQIGHISNKQWVQQPLLKIWGRSLLSGFGFQEKQRPNVSAMQTETLIGVQMHRNSLGHIVVLHASQVFSSRLGFSVPQSRLSVIRKASSRAESLTPPAPICLDCHGWCSQWLCGDGYSEFFVVGGQSISRVPTGPCVCMSSGCCSPTS